MILEGGLALAAISSLLYSTEKSTKIDSEALIKRAKAFAKESEANEMVKRKKEFAEKKLEKVARKKRAVVESIMPEFIKVYGQIQKIIRTSPRSNDELVVFSEENTETFHSELVRVQRLSDKQLLAGTFFRGIGRMFIEDSERNLSAARSQMRAANVVYSQAVSVSEVYDTISDISEKLSSLIVRMSSLFLGSISETNNVISTNGTDINNYSKKDKQILMLCVNLASAISELINVPVLDENSGVCIAAAEMIQTGEEQLDIINKKIRE